MTTLSVQTATYEPAFPLRILFNRGAPERITAGWGMAAEQPESTERSLVDAARKGDNAALRALLEKISPPLYSAVILPRVGDAAAAEEILRDALCRAVEKLDTFQWTDAGIFPWVRQIAVNMVIDRARRLQRQSRAMDALETHVAVTETDHHADAEQSLIEAQERALASQQLRAALGTVSERYRRAIVLRLIEERSREECAQELGVTVGNFDVILHRALAALRKGYGVR